MDNLDKYLRANSSLANKKDYSPILTELRVDLMQGAHFNTSKANLGEFVKYATGGTALGTFTDAAALDIATSITYEDPHSRLRTFGKPVMGIFQGAGTLQANMIYPIKGGSVTLGRYDIQGGEVDYTRYNGTADEARWMITDTNGTSTQTITFAVNWLFTDYRSDTVV